MTAIDDERAGMPGESAPDQWAIVELMGRVTLIGRISERAIAGSPTLRVDRLDGRVQYVSPQSLYRLTECSQDEARRAHEAEARQWYGGAYGLPGSLALAVTPERVAIAATGSPWADDEDAGDGGPF